MDNPDKYKMLAITLLISAIIIALALMLSSDNTVVQVICNCTNATG